MRHHQADKADRAGHTDDGGGDQRRGGEEDQAYLWHGNPQRGGGIIAEGERIQRPGIPQTDRQAREHHHDDQLEFGPANAAEAAQQPEHHIARLLRAGGGADGIGRDGVK